MRTQTENFGTTAHRDGVMSLQSHIDALHDGSLRGRRQRRPQSNQSSAKSQSAGRRPPSERKCSWRARRTTAGQSGRHRREAIAPADDFTSFCLVSADDFGVIDKVITAFFQITDLMSDRVIPFTELPLIVRLRQPHLGRSSQCSVISRHDLDPSDRSEGR